MRGSSTWRRGYAPNSCTPRSAVVLLPPSSLPYGSHLFSNEGNAPINDALICGFFRLCVCGHGGWILVGKLELRIASSSQSLGCSFPTHKPQGHAPRTAFGNGESAEIQSPSSSPTAAHSHAARNIKAPRYGPELPRWWTYGSCFVCGGAVLPGRFAAQSFRSEANELNPSGGRAPGPTHRKAPLALPLFPIPRMWQTYRTQNAVLVTGVWVQVPSSVLRQLSHPIRARVEPPGEQRRREAYHGWILWSASFFDRIPMMMMRG